MHKKNVSLNGLRMFETAARHLSFTNAAQELSVSQAAVSQQIRTLEEQLGVKLFERGTRHLALSQSGHELATTTRSAIHNIQSTIDRITGTNANGVLTVSMLSSFASRWLIPRLDAFQNKHSDIELHIHTSGKKVNLITSNVDAAIRLAANKEPELISEFLMHDALCFVSTPAIAKDIEKKKTNLYKYTLALDGTQSHLLNSQVQDKTKEATEKSLKSLRLNKDKLKMTVFGQSDNVVLSALTGKSIALTRLSLCLDDLEAGRLQILLDHCISLNYGYSLIYSEVRANNIDLLKFKKWVGAEANKFSKRLSKYLTDA